VIKLDYTLEDPQARNELVKKILEENPDVTDSYLEILGDYLIRGIEKQERKEKKIKALSENHAVTVQKRETSLEGLISKLENGEDGIYNLISDNKQTIFQPKVQITKKDLEEIPFLKQIREAIQWWEQKLKTATGRDAYIIKKAIIDLRKDQYVVKDAYRKPIRFNKITRSNFPTKLEDDYSFDAEGYVVPKGISLCDTRVCSAILCNYSKLRQDAYGRFDSDLYYLMESFDDVCDRALKEFPMYEKIVLYKIDGMQNVDIQQALKEEFGTTHSLEYISSLWRNKIPGLIASKAEDDLLDWHYLNVEKGKYKKCSRCGEIKLAHNKYFSKNKTSKDGFYSICKCCRNSKGKKA
jgi:hypothetical protein